MKLINYLNGFSLKVFLKRINENNPYYEIRNVRFDWKKGEWLCETVKK